jgi:hypothetical protein
VGLEARQELELCSALAAAAISHQGSGWVEVCAGRRGDSNWKASDLCWGFLERPLVAGQQRYSKRRENIPWSCFVLEPEE